LAPVVTIILCGVGGYFVYGWLGAVIGAIIGWCISMAIGMINTQVSGGLLPKKLRKRSALLFYMNHEALVTSCTEGMKKETRLQLIEALIERIFKRATINAPMLSKTMGMSVTEVEVAAMQESHDESDSNVRRLVIALKDHILTTMY